MKTLITIFTVLFFLSCINNKENETSTYLPDPEHDSTLLTDNIKSNQSLKSETTACNIAATDILKLRDATIQADLVNPNWLIEIAVTAAQK